MDGHAIPAKRPEFGFGLHGLACLIGEHNAKFIAVEPLTQPQVAAAQGNGGDDHDDAEDAQPKTAPVFFLLFASLASAHAGLWTRFDLDSRIQVACTVRSL